MHAIFELARDIFREHLHLACLSIQNLNTIRICCSKLYVLRSSYPESAVIPRRRLDDAPVISDSPENGIGIHINDIQFRPDRMVVLYPDHFSELNGVTEIRGNQHFFR